MDFETTLIVGGAAVALAVFCGWRGARRPDPNKGPRLIPWRPLMVSFFVISLFMLIHLVNLNK